MTGWEAEWRRGEVHDGAAVVSSRFKLNDAEDADLAFPLLLALTNGSFCLQILSSARIIVLPFLRYP